MFKTFETLLQDKQQLNQSKAKKMPVSSQRSCDSDPMEVIEKMRQMRQNRVLQRHKSGSVIIGRCLMMSFWLNGLNPEFLRRMAQV